VATQQLPFSVPDQRAHYFLSQYPDMHQLVRKAMQDRPGDMWHALARLHGTHPQPVGRVGPLARPSVLLFFSAAQDVALTARVLPASPRWLPPCPF
jgi:hypothetical protein